MPPLATLSVALLGLLHSAVVFVALLGGTIGATIGGTATFNGEEGFEGEGGRTVGLVFSFVFFADPDKLSWPEEKSFTEGVTFDEVLDGVTLLFAAGVEDGVVAGDEIMTGLVLTLTFFDEPPLKSLFESTTPANGGLDALPVRISLRLVENWLRSPAWRRVNYRMLVN